MPDISLLQREYYGPEEEEKRLPGLISTTALVLLIICIGAYVGLFLYYQVLESQSELISQSIADLKTGDTSQTGDLKALGMLSRTLVTLRETHTYPTKIFAALERSAHPAMYFSNAEIDMRSRTVTGDALIESSVQLVRQVGVYDEEKEAGDIVDFSINDIGYDEQKGVKFSVNLIFPQ